MKFFKYVLKTVLIILIIGIGIYLVRAFDSRNGPTLSLWHTIKPSPELLLNKEFSSFEEFVKADKEYIKENFKKVESTQLSDFERYNPQGKSYSLVGNNNYNSSFVMDPGEANTKAVIVLIHGLSDSPYHIHDLGEYFKSKGYYVFGLRMPGHGTLPSGLLDVSWQDWYKAVQWSMKQAGELAKQRGGIEVHMGGFSTGGSLCIHHSLLSAEDESLVKPNKVFLFSPAAGVDKMAVVASWHKGLSWLGYFQKFAWLDILPEYDPAKYMSFTKNAGRQVFLLCEENKHLADKINKNKLRHKLPSFIAFESWVDATVIVNDLVDFYKNIGDENDLLVLVDVNRNLSSFMKPKIGERLPKDINLDKSDVFATHIIANKLDSLGRMSNMASIFSLENGSYTSDLYSDEDSQWPENFFALSHIGLPISPSNKLYGEKSYLSSLQVHGERNVLLVPSADIMRIRYNPFFDLMTLEIDRFILEEDLNADLNTDDAD